MSPESIPGLQVPSDAIPAPAPVRGPLRPPAMGGALAPDAPLRATDADQRKAA